MLYIGLESSHKLFIIRRDSYFVNIYYQHAPATVLKKSRQNDKTYSCVEETYIVKLQTQTPLFNAHFLMIHLISNTRLYRY